MKRNMMIVCCVCISIHIVLAQDGVIDSSFNGTGKLSTAIGDSHDYGASVLIQPDGKIVVSGQSYGFSRSQFCAVRYLTNGSLDTTFDKDGKVTTQLDDHFGTAVTSLIQPDGKIVLGGAAHTVDGVHSYFALVRYHSNGSIDSSFGSAGIVLSSIRSETAYDECRSIALQSDGKIVAVGYSDTTISESKKYHIAVARYNTDGTLDHTFSGDGRLISVIGGTQDYAMSTAVQSDGRIIVAGYVSLTNSDFALLRYLTNGSLDTTFGTGGIVTTAFGSGEDRGKGVVIQPDGKIVVAGYAAMSTGDFALARYDTSGTLDPSFNIDGKVTCDFTAKYDGGEGIVLQPDGKIIVVGTTIKSNVYFSTDVALVRFTTSGYLDATFGSGGKVTTAFGGLSVSAQGISAAVQSDGGIVAVGYTGGNADFAVARYRLAVPLPVELTSFTAILTMKSVELNWNTATETNNHGFEIERSVLNHRSIGSLNQSADEQMDQWIQIGFVEGNGTTNAPKSYSFTDRSANGKISYRLKQIDRDGKFEYSQTVEVTASTAPKEFALEQNYPNPFNPTTTMQYSISVGADANPFRYVTLTVYDALGREAATLVNEVKEAGTYSQQFDGARLSSGMYFARLTSNGRTQIRKLLLMK